MEFEENITLMEYLSRTISGSYTKRDAARRHTQLAAEFALEGDFHNAEVHMNLANEAELRRPVTLEDFKILNVPGLPHQISSDQIGDAIREYYESQGWSVEGQSGGIYDCVRDNESRIVNMTAGGPLGFLVTVLKTA